MELETIIRLTSGIPHTTPDKGSILYETILERGYSKCLELGFAHGVGSAFMCGALDAQGAGTLVSVDLEIARTRRPSADDVLEKLGLTSYVNFVYHPISYNWFLMDCIEREIKFDFCFLDGAHTWDVDGFAFFLANECLERGGMIIFDDLDWSFEKSPSLHNKPNILAKPDFERKMCQVRQVFELLVKKHALYVDVYERDGWGYAIKA